MAPPLPTNPSDTRSQAFPALTPQQIDRIRPYGHVRPVKKGEILFEPNDANVPFFVLLSGRMEIVQPEFEGERYIVSHEPGEFTGEITMISGQRCLVRGRVTEPGEFLEIPAENLRSLVARDEELGDILLRAFILRRLELIRHGYGNVILLGSRHSAQTLQLREFFSRNAYPYTYIDLDTDQTSQELLDRFNVKPSEIPVVVCNGQTVLRSPSIRSVASCLGMSEVPDKTEVRDVIIVGAGPAGLASAVYAASEGLNVIVFETNAPGGQAGSSSKIENYLGFPTGISGQELASRAATQALKFGASLIIARQVEHLNCASPPYKVVLDGGDSLLARTVVIATGARYNKPGLANLEKFEGQGIYYGATYIESQLCAGEEVAVVGGGNSAGQAAVFLSRSTRKLHMLVRSGGLKSTMSRYLIQRLTDNPLIELHFNTEVVALRGNDHLEQIDWKNKQTGEISTHNMQHLFIMAGASPSTEWLRGCLSLDEKGFILTGRQLVTNGWPLTRAPQMLGTSLPGVFAVVTCGPATSSESLPP